jgi:V/A-type H+-transporting ATPase subunit I
MRVDKYEVLGGLDQSNHTFLLEGYVPAVKAKKLEDLITTKFDAVVEFSDPTEEEDTPVLLKNNGFTAPVETVVESYSLPSKGEIDPSFLVSLFYYVLFGMMLGDAGYGLIIALATGICLLKFKGMEKGMKKTLTMFFFCGVSTAIWGVIFGSFFGDTVNVVASTFFNRPDVTVKALWFEPINEPMRMMAFCFLVGLIHLFTGLGAKLYELLKAGKVLDAIYDVVFWYMLVGGAVIYLLSMPMITNMLAITWLMPANVAKIASYVAIVGAIGIILTGGRDSKNWGIRIAKGLYSFYGITSYLSDVLSYSRLLALGLATSVIASVFNKMGSMGGSGIVGVIMFILVFLVGQTLNLLINLLGAYVHTNRLQFVEFFGKFYEGGGRAFEPFTENTKYFKIKEDM